MRYNNAEGIGQRPARASEIQRSRIMSPLLTLRDHPAPTAATAQRLRALEGKASGTLVIHEIYRSLQGESTFAGLPCVFVRTAVCDARCVWCDTPHAFNQGTV